MHTELYAIVAAYLMGLAASRCGLPPLVGYLGAGYLLHYFDVPLSESIYRISDLGIELLLFTVGLKLQWQTLLRREVLGVGSLHMLIVTGCTGLGFLWLNRQITGGLLLGTSLAFSSTVLAVKVLEDNNELFTLHGRLALGILIFQDVVAVGILAFRFFTLSRNDELKLLLGIFLAFSGGELAKAIGVSEDLGALWMGALLAGHSEAKDLADKLWSLKEAFLIAFFLQIGLSGIPDSSQFMQALQLLLFLPLQGILFFLMFVFLRLRARTAFVTALALTTYSEFALITTRMITDTGLLPAYWNSVMGVAVALSLALAAPLNRFSHRIFTTLEPFLIRFERAGKHPDHAPTRIGSAQWLVIGLGRTGTAAYKALEKRSYPVLGLDADPTRLAKHRQQNRRVLYGDAEDPDLWDNLSFQGLIGVILALPGFETRRLAVQQLRSRGFRGLIGVSAFNPEEDRVLRQLKADVIFHPLDEAGERLAERMEESLHA
jgi:glutathione-regulated potassium-efflux system ancillary protein KefC